MDSANWDTVTEETWPQHLPHILRDLSDCTFVALDCEFSGIPAHQSLAARRQTLQERYAESREAARKFQVLQIGLTIVKEDVVASTSAGKYILKPYNIHLSPLIDPGLGIDRTFSFSSAAVQFLLKAGFNLETPFKEGVRYLSTKEEDQAIQEVRKHSSRARTASTAQLELPKEGSESLAFLKDVRRDIDKWLANGKKKQDYFNIPSQASVSSGNKRAVTSLNRFQKRLVHQLVEAEYPSLKSIGRSDFVQLVEYNEEREERFRQQKMRRLEMRLLQHRGVRWILDALTGGDLSPLGHASNDFEHMVQGDAARRVATSDLTTDANISAKIQSKQRRPPVVGHNLFLDMIYLCQCFYGDLPDRVEGFIQLVHEKFPLLIDTKYIFTHGCGDMNPVASLDVIDDAFKHITKPELVIDPKHTRYQGKSEHAHEAGYDSLLTAKNFIRQATQLPDARVRSSPQKIDRTAPLTNPLGQAKSTDTPVKNPNSKFAHKNLFAMLEGDESNSLDLATELNELAMADANDILIPSFSSPTWKIYGNKLRVFGTMERVCVLESRPESSGT